MVYIRYYRNIRKDHDMYLQPLPFTKLLYLQMRNETIDYCCQNFLKTEV